MERFDSNDVNYMIRSGLSECIDELSANKNEINIFLDLSDDNVDLQLSKNYDIPDNICELTAEFINMLIDISG